MLIWTNSNEANVQHALKTFYPYLESFKII
jgi:hypothetical protein